MQKFVVLLCAVSCAMGAAIPEGMLPQLDGRIVGGTKAEIFDFPWQVSVQRGRYHSCGGSICNHNTIITAAHCLQYVSPFSLKIRAGSSYWNSGGVLVNVAAFKNHEGYNPSNMVNDIAVIRLVSSLAFSSTIKAIDMASIVPPNGAAAIVSGWGTTSFGGINPTQLREVDVKIVVPKICRSSYRYGSEIMDDMICAYTVGKDSCQGDSGGPLVSGGKQVGVVSWGHGCAIKNYPGVYTSVAVFHSWIINTAFSI